MRKTAAKTEETRLDGSAQTEVDQTESRAKPAADARNLAQFARQMPEQQHNSDRGLDRRDKYRQHPTEGVLLGECRLKSLIEKLEPVMHHLKAADRLKALMIIGLFFLLSPGGLLAATIEPRTNALMGCNIMVSGMIVEGDAERLRQVIEAQRQSATSEERAAQLYTPVGQRICFNSPGGSMPEGMDMASVILEVGRGTAVASNHVCESACALAFMAGNYFTEGESVVADRVLHPRARLGFHSPALEVPKGSYSAAEVEKGFLIALETLALITERRSNENYKFPESLFLTVLRTPSSQMHHIETVGQASRLNIAVAPTSFSEKNVKTSIAYICVAIDNGLLDSAANSQAFNISDASNKYIEIEGSAANGVRGMMPFGFRGEAASSCEVNMFSFPGTTARSQSLRSIGYALIGQTEGRGEVWAFHSFPPETRLSDLPTNFHASWQRFGSAVSASAQQSDPASCWVTSGTVKVVNVNEYVNLRRRADFSADIVLQIPRDGRLSIPKPSSVKAIGKHWQQCQNACQSVRNNTGGQAAKDRVRQCIDDNVVWYQVMTSGGKRGWVSRKFLEEE